MELDNLQEWEGRFYAKYNIVGTIVDRAISAVAAADTGS